MKSWLFSVAILFILAKALLWVKGFILPLPIYVLAGAFLAIASNYDKGIMSVLSVATMPNDQPNQNNTVVSQTAFLEEVAQLPESNPSS